MTKIKHANVAKPKGIGFFKKKRRAAWVKAKPGKWIELKPKWMR